MSSSNGNLKISTTELHFPLSTHGPESTYSIITLRHVGKIEDHIAFKVKTTHPQRYAVTPNKGVLSPNSSVKLKIIFVKKEKQKLWHILGLVGQNAINMGSDALIVHSCNVASSRLMAEINNELLKYGCNVASSRGLMAEINNNLLKSATKIENIKIRVYHYITTEYNAFSSSLGSNNQKVLLPFPATIAVRSCLDEIRKDGNFCVTLIVTLCGVAGILITTCATLCLGVIPLQLGLDSLIKIIYDRGKWVNELRRFNQNSDVIEGRVLKREKKVDDILNKEKYLVQLQYEGTEEDGDVRTCVVNYSSEAVMHGAKELYEMTEESTVVPLKILPGYPSSAIPSFLLENKLKVSLYWAKYLHYLRAILGILTYLWLGHWWHAFFPIDIVLPCLVGGIFLFIPLNLSLVKKASKLKRKLLYIEPASIPTEYDGYLCFLEQIGPSPFRRLKIIMAIVGSFTGTVMSPPGFLILVIFSFLPLMSLSSSSRRRKGLQRFEEQAISVRGKIHSRRLDSGAGRDSVTSYYASIRYALRISEDDVYIFEREVESRNLYNNVGMKVQIIVDPKHPRSGHSRETLTNMIRMEACHWKIMRYMSIFFGTCVYFFLHWAIYHSTDQAGTGPLMAVFIMWSVTGIAPILVIPQILVWGEIDRQQCNERMLSGAKVVDLRRGSSSQRSKNNHPYGTAIQVDVEEELRAPFLAKAIPIVLEKAISVLLDDASVHTLATELTDGESSIEFTVPDNFEYLNVVDGHACDGLV